MLEKTENKRKVAGVGPFKKTLTGFGVEADEGPDNFGFRAPTPDAAVPNVWLVNVTYKNHLINICFSFKEICPNCLVGKQS